MINKDFTNFNKAKKYVNAFLNVSMTFCIIIAILLIIGGIIIASYDIVTGVTYIISGAIACGFGIFMTYMIHSLLTVFVWGMNDIKNIGITIESIADSTRQLPAMLKYYESCTNYYLYYIDKDSYLSSNSTDGQGLRVVKDVLYALKFQSEEEAKRFAVYNRLKLGENWKIVKKNPNVPNG